jgi:hypothetical protein
VQGESERRLATSPCHAPLPDGRECADFNIHEFVNIKYVVVKR